MKSDEQQGVYRAAMMAAASAPITPLSQKFLTESAVLASAVVAVGAAEVNVLVPLAGDSLEDVPVLDALPLSESEEPDVDSAGVEDPVEPADSDDPDEPEPVPVFSPPGFEPLSGVTPVELSALPLPVLLPLLEPLLEEELELVAGADESEDLEPPEPEDEAL